MATPDSAKPRTSERTRIVLVGGGHAHLHLMHVATGHARAQGLDQAAIDWVLISPFPRHHYSGMVPGYLAGAYEEEDLAFDLAGITARQGARRIEGMVTRISMADREVEVEGEPAPIPFDRISLDLGSVPVGMDAPGVREHAATVRPMSRAVALRRRVDGLLATLPTGRPLRLAVVGGGSAAVEVALALGRRVRAQGHTPNTTLFEAGPHILPDFSDVVREVGLGILHEAGVTVRTGSRVAALEPRTVILDDGTTMPADLVLWLTGAAPPPVLAASDLPTAPDGFFYVDATLQAVDGSPAWGAGDCIALAGHPRMPRAGVYAVRQSPILAANVLAGRGVRQFVPQHSFLSLMNTADGRALLRWKSVVAHTRWAWWLKDRIDRRFMTLYSS